VNTGAESYLSTQTALVAFPLRKAGSSPLVELVTGANLTAGTTFEASARRDSDGKIYNWTDNTWYAEGDAGLILPTANAPWRACLDLSTAYAPGVWGFLWDLSAIVGHVFGTEERVVLKLRESGGNADAQWVGEGVLVIDPPDLVNAHTLAQIENQIWDAILASHDAPGSTGEALANAGVGACATPEEIAAYLRAQAAICTLPALDGLAPVYLKAGDRYPIFDRVLSRDGLAINLATGGPSGGAAAGASLNYWPEGGTGPVVSRGGGGVEETVPKRGTSTINIDGEIA
jgi:hypothetical protein